MQVIKDPIENAAAIMTETTGLLGLANTLDSATLPVAELMKVSKVKKTPPVLIAEAGKSLKEHDEENFEVLCPTLASAAKNGKLGDFSYRMHDAMYQIGEVILAARKVKYMVVKDDQRKQLNEMAKTAIGDLVAYLVNTFAMWDSETSCMAVASYCERNGITQDLLYGTLLENMKNAGQTHRAYEPMSPVYTELMAADSVFMAECSENDLPLTDDQAMQLLRGELTSSEIMDQLTKGRVVTPFSKGEEVTPFNLLSRLSLDF